MNCSPRPVFINTFVSRDTFGVCAQEQDWRRTTPPGGKVDTRCVSRLWRAMHLDGDLLWGED